MNNKRQTVWLVSMLSLMVVLSAYYLFTADATKLDPKSSDAANVQDIKVNSKELTKDGAPANPSAAPGALAAGKDAKATAAPSSKPDDAKTAAKAGTTGKSGQAADVQKPDAKAADAGVTGTNATDDMILKKLESQSQSGADQIAARQLKRNEDVSKKYSLLQAVITDSKQNTDALAQAYNDMNALEQKEAKITGIEDTLQKDFMGAMVTEDGTRWKVLVQNDKLEKTQAVTIVDLVMKELNVGPEMVSVQLLRD